MSKKVFVLSHSEARQRAGLFLATAPQGYVVTFSEATRNLEQNAKFHAICSELDGQVWAGAPRNAAAWKVLLISGHAVATKEGAEIIPGLESEFVNIRESSASMSKKRASSLIEYALAFCANYGIELREAEAA